MRKVVLTIEVETNVRLSDLRKIKSIEFKDGKGSGYLYDNDDSYHGKIEQVQANVVKS